MPKYYRDNKSDRKLIYTIKYPDMEPVIVIPIAKWKRLVELTQWTVFPDNMGGHSDEAELDAIVQEVEKDNA